MPRQHLCAAALAALVLSVAGTARAGDGDSISTVMGSITVSPGEHRGDLSTVNGSIHVGESAAVGHAHTVNGSLTLAKGADVTSDLANVNGGIRVNAAHVGGDVETVTGGIEIGPDAHVDGGVIVRREHSSDSDARGPQRIVIGPGSVVKGTLKFERPVELYVSDRATIGPVEGATPVKFAGDHPPG